MGEGQGDKLRVQLCLPFRGLRPEMVHECFGVHATVASDVLDPFEQSYRRSFLEVRVALEM